MNKYAQKRNTWLVAAGSDMTPSTLVEAMQKLEEVAEHGDEKDIEAAVSACDKVFCTLASLHRLPLQHQDGDVRRFHSDMRRMVNKITRSKQVNTDLQSHAACEYTPFGLRKKGWCPLRTKNGDSDPFEVRSVIHPHQILSRL